MRLGYIGISPGNTYSLSDLVISCYLALDKSE